MADQSGYYTSNLQFSGIDLTASCTLCMCTLHFSVRNLHREEFNLKDLWRKSMYDDVDCFDNAHCQFVLF